MKGEGGRGKEVGGRSKGEGARGRGEGGRWKGERRRGMGVSVKEGAENGGRL